MASHTSVAKCLALYQTLGCVHLMAVFIACGLTSTGKKMASCEPNTWPPGSSEPGHNMDADTQALAHTDRSLSY